MDDDDEFEPSYPWSWRATLVITADCVANMLRDASDLVNALATQVAADHNYRIDRKQFQEDAALELERLTEGEDG